MWGIWWVHNPPHGLVSSKNPFSIWFSINSIWTIGAKTWFLQTKVNVESLIQNFLMSIKIWDIVSYWWSLSQRNYWKAHQKLLTSIGSLWSSVELENYCCTYRFFNEGGCQEAKQQQKSSCCLAVPLTQWSCHIVGSCTCRVHSKQSSMRWMKWLRWPGHVSLWSRTGQPSSISNHRLQLLLYVTNHKANFTAER